MPLSDARRKRLERIEAMLAAEPTMSQQQLADLLDVSQISVSRDLRLLKKRAAPERKPALTEYQDLIMENGVWCALCACGEYVPIMQEGGDQCPRCGLTLRVQVLAS